MTYRYVLFDLDGTMTDPFDGLSKSVIYSCEKMGIAPPPLVEIRKFIGPPLIHSYMSFLGFDETRAEQAIACYREYYNEKGIYENSVYEGIPEVLDALKQAGVTLSVATSKPDHFADIVLRHFDLLKYFDHVEAVTTHNAAIEKEHLVRSVLEKYNVQGKSQAVMVGDRLYDLNGANANGIDSIGVLYGYGDLAEMRQYGATYTAQTPQQILKIILDQ